MTSACPRWHKRLRAARGTARRRPAPRAARRGAGRRRARRRARARAPARVAAWRRASHPGACLDLAPARSVQAAPRAKRRRDGA
jgi:hypothetical protein